MKDRKATKRVLQITSYPPPRAGWGIRVYYLKQEMEKRGDICEVLNIGKSKFLKGQDFIPVFSGFDYIKKIFKYRLRGYLVHIHLNGDSVKGFILTIVAQMISLLTFRLPVITFHAGPVQLYFPRFKAPYLTIMYKFIFYVSRFIICNNQAVKNNIMSYGVSDKKIYTIPAFSKQYLNFKRIPLNPQLEEIFSSKFPVIASYIFLRPVYFIEDILEALYQVKQRFPDVFLIFMGYDHPEEKKLEQYSDKIKQKIKNLDLDDSIYFTGDLDHDTFLNILSKSTLFLRTHYKDGVSSSVLEGLALKIPVVASENGIRPKQVITYENNNVSDMVDKLVYTIKNHTLLRDNLQEPAIDDTVSKEIELLDRA